ncbi:hypothetical protein MTO99_04035 [Agromyces larvae]|uniref:Uncharacterized protein n=1 Tax=Agromyces larvae TaxID=2929802 RepID=A0ABY4C0N2_9MICO|nr:hypothetical protein [Agromyces larvae]UOE44958.1 hypothetical protein MTO99_04035 [Agromyces larvae]
MPKAAVDEDRDSLSREHDVWAHHTCGKLQAHVFAESEAARVEFGTNRSFRTSIGTLDGSHVAGATRRRENLECDLPLVSQHDRGTLVENQKGAKIHGSQSSIHRYVPGSHQ